MTIASNELPGRLGDPEIDLRSDPRSDPKMLSVLAPLHLDRNVPPPQGVSRQSPREEQLAWAEEFDRGLEGALTQANELAVVPDGVDETTHTIRGRDGNQILLHIARPLSADAPLSGVVHLHGGGRIALSAAIPSFVQLRKSIAQRGVVVIGVEFRNGAGEFGPHPHPAGLNDCYDALMWVHQNCTVLGVSHLIVGGDSGGGNLALAVALKAKREETIAMIRGVVSFIPAILGEYGGTVAERRERMQSMAENDGYLLESTALDIMAAIIDPTGAHADDPLCWPLKAAREDVTGLPPHVISVNELDFHRDEGIAYHHKLIEAGVDSTLRFKPGLCHGADLMSPRQMPDEYAAAVSVYADLATRVAPIA
jgi:acetyl esterase/lipase